MTDSESGSGPVLRWSERQRSLTKKIAPYDERMEELKQRREESKQKKTVAKKRQTGLKLLESAQSKLSPVPERSLLSPKASQFPTGRDSDSRTPTKGKGKGHAEDPQPLQAVAKGGCIISPDKESRSKGSGPRLGFSDDVEPGEFDNEPAPHKPLAVCAIDAPESLPAESQSANDSSEACKSRSITNLFLQKRRADEENQDRPPNKCHQHKSSANLSANFGPDPDLRNTVRNGESTLERPPPSTSQAAQPQSLSHSTDGSGRGELGNSREISVAARLSAPSKQAIPKPSPLTQDSSQRPEPDGNSAGSAYRGHTQVPDCRSPPPINRPRNPPEFSRPRASSRPRSRSPGRWVADTATDVDQQRGDSQLGPRALSPRRRLPSPRPPALSPRRRSPASRRRSLSPRRAPNPPQRLELPRGHPQAPHLHSSTPHRRTNDVPRPRDPPPRQNDTQTSAQSNNQQRRTGPTTEANERRSSARSDPKQNTSQGTLREKASNSRASKTSAGRSRSKQKSAGKSRSKSRRDNRRGKHARESTEEEEESDEADNKDEDADNKDVVKVTK
ncbi:hypothetical protein RSOLAG22IIIB_07510 [Rhizoctonia solani]|uniref:Uncharacterized protein n=1 Tax=Rhizoctonia solani TaxID=456999 RepID=A0A0K6FN44_9AGAM|nr:hypothetical protein RSOLAG22IIIB_07510 [Rhizoctonia solani]